jgi:predicted dinucleotide-binding enzyme
VCQQLSGVAHVAVGYELTVMLVADRGIVHATNDTHRSVRIASPSVGCMHSDTQSTALNIAILGTGGMAEALGQGWARAGNRITIGGRSADRADALARRIGGETRSGSLRYAATGRDAVLLAVTWGGVADTLRGAGAAEGTLAGTTLIDCTNAVEHGVGTMRADIPDSAAQRIAAQAPGAHIVKAFNVFPADTWTTAPPTTDPASQPVVALAGDHPASVALVSRLVLDVGATPAVLGSLHRARQIEEVAGFVIGLAFSGHDPASAVPTIR